jgi:hypothetical protein
MLCSLKKFAAAGLRPAAQNITRDKAWVLKNLSVAKEKQAD